jgi:diaminopimelate epimerase
MLDFAKVQAVGNDFLIVSVDDIEKLPDAAALATAICDRKLGAGADGVVFVAKSSAPTADFESRIFNADGGEAEVSGNGTRCLAAYLYYQGLRSEPEITILTRAGVKRGRLVSRIGTRYEFDFDMGRPVLASNQIPIAIDPPQDKVVGRPLMLGSDLYKITCTSMGNPHCTIFVDDLDTTDIDGIGGVIERHPLFPNRTNVEFVRVLSTSEIEVRFWERGVGRTLSSGTGSCAASVASALNGFTSRNITVSTLGGLLKVDWLNDDSVTLTGSADIVYQGRWLKT